MQSFTLPKKVVNSLTNFVDSIPLKDLGVIKEIRVTSNLVKDLEEGNKEYREKVIAHGEKQSEIVKKYQEQFADLSEEEKKEKEKEINANLKKELDEALTDEAEGLKKEGEGEITMELSDDKYNKLKELFTDRGSKTYTDKEVFMSIADAFEL